MVVGGSAPAGGSSDGGIFLPAERRRKRLEHVSYKIPDTLLRARRRSQYPRRPYLEYSWDNMCWDYFQRVVLLDQEPFVHDDQEDMAMDPQISESSSSEEEPEEEKEFNKSRYLPQGVVMIHLMELYNIKFRDTHIDPTKPYYLYIEMKCAGRRKLTPIYQCANKQRLIIDFHCYFSIEVINHRRAQRNQIFVRLFIFQDPKYHYRIAYRPISIFDAMRDLHGIMVYDLWDELYFVKGCIAMELAFAYGTFGYGGSDQIHNSKFPLPRRMGVSMFPRCSPSWTDVIDNLFHTRAPKKLRMVTMHNLVVHSPSAKRKRGVRINMEPAKSTGNVEELFKHRKEAKPVLFFKVQYRRNRPYHARIRYDINQKFIEADFNDIYGYFLCKSNRRSRVRWLYHATMGKLRHFFERDIGELFFPLDVNLARKALRSQRPRGAPISYMKHFPKPEPLILGTRFKRRRRHKLRLKQDLPIYATQLPPPIKLVDQTNEDLKFHKVFQPAPRYSGYLSIMFGFEPPCPLRVEPLDSIGHPEMYDFQDPKPMKLRKFLRVSKWILYGLYLITFFVFVKALMYTFTTLRFIWNLDDRPWYRFKKLPEISVSGPPPEPDAQEKYLHFMRERKFVVFDPDAIRRFKKKLSKVRHADYLQKKQVWNYGLPELKKPGVIEIAEKVRQTLERERGQKEDLDNEAQNNKAAEKKRIRRIRPSDGVKLEIEVADLNL